MILLKSVLISTVCIIFYNLYVLLYNATISRTKSKRKFRWNIILNKLFLSSFYYFLSLFNFILMINYTRYQKKIQYILWFFLFAPWWYDDMQLLFVPLFFLSILLTFCVLSFGLKIKWKYKKLIYNFTV